MVCWRGGGRDGAETGPGSMPHLSTCQTRDRPRQAKTGQDRHMQKQKAHARLGRTRAARMTKKVPWRRKYALVLNSDPSSITRRAQHFASPGRQGAWSISQHQAVDPPRRVEGRLRNAVYFGPDLATSNLAA